VRANSRVPDTNSKRGDRHRRYRVSGTVVAVVVVVVVVVVANTVTAWTADMVVTL
jgi:t-SNARE complex subunit (syntaxin)